MVSRTPKDFHYDVMDRRRKVVDGLKGPTFSLGELTISPFYHFQFPAFPHNFYFQVTNDLFKFLDSQASEMADPLAVPHLLSLPISSNIYTNMRNRTD
jgi:hypothetical protein